MARTKVKLFWERMKDARSESGLSLDEVCYRIRDIAPSYWRRTSRATVSRLEQPDAVEEAADPVVLQLLALIYEKELVDLSPRAAEAFERILELPALVTSDMWPYSYSQLALALDDKADHTNGATWKIHPSSTRTEPRSERAGYRPPRSAVIERSTRRSPRGLEDAA